MFTRKEQTFFKDPYFKVIREEEQFIEVQSVSTGHCWNVFKNQFETSLKITLYHKHNVSDIYNEQKVHNLFFTIYFAGKYCKKGSGLSIIIITVLPGVVRHQGPS